MDDDRRSNQWPDTETKAFLQQSLPAKVAPPGIETFSIVVLCWDDSADPGRRVRAFARALQTSHVDAEFQASRKPPFVAKRGLTLTDAMLAQFELICCDVISVFIADDVISGAPLQYLADLYNDLIRSDEFAVVEIRVAAIPANDAGNQFVQQFIGDHAPPLPHTMLTTFKKVRMMFYWAERIGADVAIATR